MEVQSLAPFEKTVAGSTPFLFAQNFPGRVFKPAHPREKEFYESIDKHPQLRKLVPKYHGTLTYLPHTSSSTSSNGDNQDQLLSTDHAATPTRETSSTTSDNLPLPTTSYVPPSPTTLTLTPTSSFSSQTPPVAEYLVMEDLTYGFTHPCILDVKLGTTHHDIDFTNPQKHPTRQSKYKTAPDLGFCLTGMQVYKRQPNRYEFMDKVEGRNLTQTTVVDKLAYFFTDGNIVRKDVITKLIQRLLMVASYFQNKPAFTFRSSSLLLLYEGKMNVDSSDRVEVKMIDFAHARRLPTSGEIEFKDEYGYLYGTNNFIKILESLHLRPDDDLAFASNTIATTHQVIPDPHPVAKLN